MCLNVLLLCVHRTRQTKVRKKTKYTILDMDEQEKLELRPKFSECVCASNSCYAPDGHQRAAAKQRSQPRFDQFVLLKKVQRAGVRK